jgi:pimeloyl-ACP methyl ester carboxylesterase
MTNFLAADRTSLAYHALGDGPPLVCLPGGPMRASAYLGDLGGLSARRRLIMLDLRGTGASAVPEDTASYRCDRQVDDVEALREHLGLERIDLLAHCAGANLAVAYVARHPERVGRLVLVTPSPIGVGIAVGVEDRLGVARARDGEAWFGEAFAALEEVVAGRAEAGHWEAVAPFFHGRWDSAAQELHAADAAQKNREAAGAFGADGAFDPEGSRAALARFGPPVLVVAGEVDLNSPPRAMSEYAGLFPDARLVVQAGASHHPWMDDAGRFRATVAEFLG